MKKIIYTILTICLFQGIGYSQTNDSANLNGNQCPTNNVKIQFNTIIEQPGQIYPDLKVPDKDGDGISDLIECPMSPCRDTDADSIPDYLDEDSDGDGLSDKFEGNTDFDNDETPNYRDLDSDDDGHLDFNDECYLEVGLNGEACLNRDRNIYWIHGYKGNYRSWEKIATNETDTWDSGFHGNGTYQAKSYFVDYDDDQTSLEDSADKIKDDIELSLYNNPEHLDPTRNFVIAHSLGGLAIRKLGRIDSINNTSKPAFNGVITFGTPHMGTAAANTLVYNSEFLESFLQKTCKSLTSGPATDSISVQNGWAGRIGRIAVGLGLVTGTIGKICDNGISLVTNPVLNFLKTGIEEELTIDAAQDIPAMNTKHNAAFYGIENDNNDDLFPRFKGAIDNSPTSEDLYKGDITDQKGLDAMAVQLDAYNASFIFHSNASSVLWPFTIWDSHGEIADAYFEGVKWFGTINNDWKRIIGGIQEEIVPSGECYCYIFFEGNMEEREIDCNSIDPNDPLCGEKFIVNRSDHPSDGFILAESAMNMPGASYTPRFMDGSNHFQMKNDSKTEQAMKKIFIKGLDKGYFKTYPR